ncbi:MAG: sigma 54-interacting transcriptional regulator, partial [Planctomycetota bacterium]
NFWEAADITPGEFPAPFPQFLERCMSRRPQRRFADAQAALEFLVGGAGRPPRSLLQPDLVALFGAELETAFTASPGDLRIEGGTEIEREQLGLHLLCTQRDVTSYRVDGDAVHVASGGPPVRTIRVPELDAERLLPFLKEVLSMQDDVATVAANFLLTNVGASPTAIGYDLVRRAAEGQIVPDGARWSWPAAAQGRLVDAPPPPSGPVTEDSLRLEAATGRGETATARFAVAARKLSAEAERPLRRALAQGFLTAGEPARALPLCSDLPVERVQALLDLGRVDEARTALATVPPEQDQEQRRDLARTAARIRAAGGEVEAALGDLRDAAGPSPRPVETQVLAALHEQLGHGEVARTLLLAVLPKVPKDTAPFVRAAVLTSLGLAERRLGRLVEAHAFLTDARALLLQLGHARHAATATHNLGLAAKDLGRLDEATEHFRQARGLFQHIGDAAGAAITEAALGNTALAAGDPVAAERKLRSALESLEKIGARAAGAHTRVLLARALALQQQGTEARKLLAELDEPAQARLASDIAQVQELLRKDPITPEPAASDRTDALPPPKSNPPRSSPKTTVQDPTGPSRELFRTFLAVNRRLASESDLDKAMNMLLESAITLCGGRTGYLLVARPDGLQREFQAGSAQAGGHAFSRSLANRSMQQQRTLTGEDALADRELKEMPSIRNLQVRSAICAPFRSGTGAAGAIYVEHAGRAGVFSEDDKTSLEVLADQAAIAVDRMLREEQLASELEHSRRELAVAQRVRGREQSTLIGDSKAMRELRAQIQKVAPLDLSVLILGETGTGKELVAQSIHQNSAVRSRGPFVAENCSALPPELMERELFGHVAGSFTGADRDRPGLLELASGGTLFLDEVGDMPPPLQSKLLRALQEKKIRRIGGSEMIDVDVRILAATHKNLRAMVQSGDFREDLFFRLAAVELQVPPLRQRDGDIDVLAQHFVAQMCRQQGI